MSYDPNDQAYRDEYSVRTEVTRVFDLCLSCRRCQTLCETFTAFFELVDRKALAEAGLLTPAEQDQMMGLCIRCGLCAQGCPYAPLDDQGAGSEMSFDISQLAVRHHEMVRHNGLVPWRIRLAELWDRLAERTNRLAKRRK